LDHKAEHWQGIDSIGQPIFRQGVYSGLRQTMQEFGVLVVVIQMGLCVRQPK
jgi:hypothetical protein